MDYVVDSFKRDRRGTFGVMSPLYEDFVKKQEKTYRGRTGGISMYSAKVMDHFEHPRNVGEIENASGVGTVGNAKCGDIMRIYLDIDETRSSGM